MKMSFVIAAALFAAPCSSTSGGAPGAAPSTSSPTPSTTVAAATTSAGVTVQAPSQDCADLVKKCMKCPDGPIKHACSLAVGAGSHDPKVCTRALADKDLNAQCN
jgi:hypothetical protein